MRWALSASVRWRMCGVPHCGHGRTRRGGVQFTSVAKALPSEARMLRIGLAMAGQSVLLGTLGLVLLVLASGGHSVRRIPGSPQQVRARG